MAVKRYDFDDTGESNCLIETQFGEWVHHEDYAALEAKAYKAGTAAGELQMRVNQLEAECERLRGELQELSGLKRLLGGSSHEAE